MLDVITFEVFTDLINQSLATSSKLLTDLVDRTQAMPSCLVFAA